MLAQRQRPWDQFAAIPPAAAEALGVGAAFPNPPALTSSGSSLDSADSANLPNCSSRSSSRPPRVAAAPATPGPNDILCGPGAVTFNHPGNIRFRKLVAAHKLHYLAASKFDKLSIARDVVREWRGGMDPPGRFLARMDNAKRVIPPRRRRPAGDDADDPPSLWFDIGDKKAREKASQCRESVSQGGGSRGGQGGRHVDEQGGVGQSAEGAGHEQNGVGQSAERADDSADRDEPARAFWEDPSPRYSYIDSPIRHAVLCNGDIIE